MNTYHIRYDSLPEHLRDGMRLYVESGIQPGGFLTAFMSNDLMGAMGRADEISRAGFFQIASFLYNDAPSNCHGSSNRVREWIAVGGLNGQRATTPAA